MQGGTLRTGQNQKSSINVDWSAVAAWFGLRVVYYEDKGEGEDQSTPYVHSHVVCYRGDWNPFYLSDNEGHCETVLSKDIFF